MRESQGSQGQYVLSGMQSGHHKHLLLVDPEGVVSDKDEDNPVSFLSLPPPLPVLPNLLSTFSLDWIGLNPIPIMLLLFLSSFPFFGLPQEVCLIVSEIIAIKRTAWPYCN